MKFLQKAHTIVCGATSQQIYKHRSNEKYWPIIKYVPQVQKTHSEVDGALNSLQKVIPVCSTLQFPCPTADTALTLTVYSVPASNPVRIGEVTRDETEMAVALSLSQFFYTPPGTERWSGHFGEWSKSLSELVPEIPLSWSM